MIALGWTLPDSRVAGRLPKYNPQGKNFSKSDWQYVCELASGGLRECGLIELAQWLGDIAGKDSPRKSDQDQLDASLCLLVAVHLAIGKDCLMVEDQQTGYIVVPHNPDLLAELQARCNRTGRAPSEWIRVFRLRTG